MIFYKAREGLLWPFVFQIDNLNKTRHSSTYAAVPSRCA